MMLVMVAIITFSAIVMGSGNAPFFAFAALTPAVAAHTRTASGTDASADAFCGFYCP